MLDRWGVGGRRTPLMLAADIRGLLAAIPRPPRRLGLSDRSESPPGSAASARGRWTRPLALYGFTSFTFAQRRLVAALARVHRSACLFSTMSAPGPGASRPRANSHSGKRSRGAGCRAYPSKSDYMSPPSPSRAALHGRRAAGDPPPAWAGGEKGGSLPAGLRPAERGGIRGAGGGRSHPLRGSPGRDRQSWCAARTPGGGCCEDVFASCGIPCEVDERLTLAETGLGHAFLLPGCTESPRTITAAVLDYLRGPFSGFTLEQAADRGAGLLARHGAGSACAERCAGPGTWLPREDLGRRVVKRAEGVFVDLDGAQSTCPPDAREQSPRSLGLRTRRRSCHR